MSTYERDRFDDVLDRALDHIRGEEPDPAAIENSARRTWQAMSEFLNDEESRSPQTIELRGCDDYRRLIPAFLEGELNEARALLLKDHSRECLPCRKALKAARSGAAAISATRKPTVKTTGAGRWRTELTWSLAAAVIIGIVLIGFAVNTDFFSLRTDGMLRVEAVDGALMEVSQARTTQLAAGQTLNDGEWIRTAKGSGAKVSLEDGSIVELAERSEMYVSRASGDDTIHLTRGSIIVQASRQGSGHLFVETDDCNVAVTGTVFAVSNGLKGSRVSVIEGEVVVHHGSRTDILASGEQVTTAGNLYQIPVSRDIAWSSDLDSHLTLLSEIEKFRADLSDRLPRNRFRTDTSLLDRAPANTVMYAGIPNLTYHLSEAYALMQERISTNPELARLWASEMDGQQVEKIITTIMDQVAKYGRQIGEEIAVTFQHDADSEISGPVVLAHLDSPKRFRKELESDLGQWKTDIGSEIPLVLLSDPSVATAPHNSALLVSIQDDLLVIAPDLEAHQAMTHHFRGTPFHKSLAQVYEEGAGIVFGADLKSLFRMGSYDDKASTVLGIDNIRHLVVNRREFDEKTLTEAALTFAGRRTGMAAWLADPGPMGALEFISPDATAVGGFVVKTPSSLVEELFAMLPFEDRQEFLDSFRQNTGLDLLEDVVAPLGGEVVFALDGPVLPKPAWKLVLEVYDPEAMQRTIQVAVEQLNRSGSGEKRPH